MWSLFVGICIGVLQVMGLYTFGKMILGDNSRTKILGAFLLLVKMALIVFIIVLISTVSLTHVIWTAGGMLLGLITAFVLNNIRQRKKHDLNRVITDGKDGSKGG